MTKFLLSLTRQQIMVFICCGMTIALVYSKFALTIGMILLLLLSFFENSASDNFRFRWNTAFRQNVDQLWKRKDFLVVTLFFLIILCSGLYSADLNYLGERLRIKLPFLLLPFAFVSIPALSQRQYWSIFYCFIFVMSGSAVFVGINYLLDYEAITMSMGRGQAIPTPTNHIRYSLLIAFAALSAAALWWKGFFIKYKWERHLLLGLTIFLLLFSHLLSVRSGLLVLYGSIFFLSIRFIILARRYWIGLAMIVSIFLMPFSAYQLMPSLQKKVSYMLYDFDQYQKGNVKNLSDAERFISMAVGMKIGNTHPWLGVGAGDLKKTVKEVYRQEHPEVSKPKMPHNQFLSVYAGTGLVGLGLFLFAFFFPLFYRRNYHDVLFSTLHMIVFGSFFIENTIETAVGVAFYSLFLLIGLNKAGAGNSMLTQNHSSSET